MLVAEKVKGFNKLGVNADLFKEFLSNFYNAWGLEARETIEPISVKYVKKRNEKPYLRFDYKINGKEDWLHVVGERAWY